MPNRRANDHLVNSRFRIEIEGVTQGEFLAVDGLEAMTEVVRFADGGDVRNRKRPGRSSFANIVLRRGYTNNQELWNWYRAVLDGKVMRRAGSIIVCGDDGTEILRYNFYEGWPCRWKSMELNAMGPTGNLVEEIEIAIEWFEHG